MTKQRALVVGQIMRLVPDGSFEPIPAGPCDVEVLEGDAVSIHWNGGTAAFSREAYSAMVGRGDLLFVDAFGR